MKVGDKVRRTGVTNRSKGVYQGQIYTVSKAHFDGMLELLEAPESWWVPGYFELVSSVECEALDPKDVQLRGTSAAKVPWCNPEGMPANELAAELEAQCWARARRINADNVCQKCSAPLPCRYH
jgi:hypothetical protein